MPDRMAVVITATVTAGIFGTSTISTFHFTANFP